MDYSFVLPKDLHGGTYAMSLGLFDTSCEPERPIELGLISNLRQADGFWLIGAVTVAAGDKLRTRSKQPLGQAIPRGCP
jgi:hypothetical protein